VGSLAAWALRHPRLTLTLFFLLFAVAGLGALRLESETGYRAALGASHASVVRLDRFIDDFGAGLPVQVAWGCETEACDDALGPAALAAAERIAAAVESSTGVRSVRTPGSTPLLDGTGGVIDSRTLLSVQDDPIARRDFIERARQDPFWRGTLVSGDARAAAILVEVDSSDPRLHAETLGRLLDAVSREVGTYSLVGDPVDFAVGGAALNRESARLGAAAVVAVAAIIWLLFRTPLAIVPVLTAVGIAAVSCLGLMGWMGWPENEISQAIVPLLLVIGVCGAIHLLSRYRDLPSGRSRLRDEDRCERLIAAAGDVGWPCFVAATTTSVGLGSFVTSDLAGFVRFGVASAVGCFVALVATFSLLPVLVRVMRLDIAPLVDSAGWALALRSLEIGTRRFAWTIVLGTGVLLVVGLAGVQRLEVDVTKDSLLGSGSNIVHWQRWVAANLRRPDSLELRLRLPQGASIGDVDTLDALSDIVARLEALPELGSTRSLLDGIKRMSQLLHGDDPEMAKVGEGRSANAQLLFLLESYDRDLLARWVTSDSRALRVSAEAQLLSKHERRALLESVRSLVDRELPEGWSYEITGPLQVFAEMVTQLHATQMTSFAGAALAVAIAISLCLRSVTAMLWAMGPSLLPIVLTLGAMGWMGNPLDTGTAMIAAIVLGIAVDDSVHVITRYKRHRDTGMRPSVAMSWSLEEVGRALVASSLALSAGFLVMLLSSWGGIAAFGLLSACAIMFALLADLLFLPALVYCFDPEGGEVSGEGEEVRAPARRSTHHMYLLAVSVVLAGLFAGIADEVGLFGGSEVDSLYSATRVFAVQAGATALALGFLFVAALRAREEVVRPLACFGASVSTIALSWALAGRSGLAEMAGVIGMALLPAVLLHLSLVFPFPRGALATSALVPRVLYGTALGIVAVSLVTHSRVPELFSFVEKMLAVAATLCAINLLLQAERDRRRATSPGQRLQAGILVGGGFIFAVLMATPHLISIEIASGLPGGEPTLAALLLLLATVPHASAIQHDRLFGGPESGREVLRGFGQAVVFVLLVMLVGTLAGVDPMLQWGLVFCGVGAWVGSVLLVGVADTHLAARSDAEVEVLADLEGAVASAGGEVGAASGVAAQLVGKIQAGIGPRFVVVFLRRPKGWFPVAASDSAPSDEMFGSAAYEVAEHQELVHLPELDRHSSPHRLLLGAGVQTVVVLRGDQGRLGVLVLGALSRALLPRDRLFLRRVASQATSALSWAEAAEQLGAARSLARRGFLSASLTHDLGKPLTTIWAAARSLRRLREGDSLVDERLREIQRVADQGLDIIDRLFEKVTEDPGGLLPAGELVAMSCETAQQRHAHSVQVHYGSDLHRVSVASEVSEALGELLSNACREAPGDSPVEVSVQLHGSTWLWIDVVDRGAGMTEAIAARAFEPWFSERRDQGGRGMGLALSRLLLRQVGGDVEIVDRGGRSGTRVRISVEVQTGIEATP
jgi:predicted RND superfamily exporter protein/signal transduction histidine kinase